MCKSECVFVRERAREPESRYEWGFSPHQILNLQSPESNTDLYIWCNSFTVSNSQKKTNIHDEKLHLHHPGYHLCQVIHNEVAVQFCAARSALFLECLIFPASALALPRILLPAPAKSEHLRTEKCKHESLHCQLRALLPSVTVQQLLKNYTPTNRNY